MLVVISTPRDKPMDRISGFSRRRVGKRGFGRAANAKQPRDIRGDVNQERRRDSRELERSHGNRERLEAGAQYMVGSDRLGEPFKWFRSRRVINSRTTSQRRRKSIKRDIP